MDLRWIHDIFHRLITDCVGVWWITTETNHFTVCLCSDWLCCDVFLTCDPAGYRHQHSSFLPPLSPHCSYLIPTTPSLPLSFDPLVPWRGSYTAWRSCVLSQICFFSLTGLLLFSMFSLISSVFHRMQPCFPKVNHFSLRCSLGALWSVAC